MKRIAQLQDWMGNGGFLITVCLELVLLITIIFILVKPTTKTDCTKLYKIASSTEVIVFLQENCK